MSQNSQGKSTINHGDEHQMQSTHEKTRSPPFQKSRNSPARDKDQLRNIKKRLATLTVGKVVANKNLSPSRFSQEHSRDSGEKLYHDLGFQVIMFVVSQQCKSVITDFKASFSTKTKSVILDDGIEALLPETTFRKIEDNNPNEIPQKNKLEFKKNHVVFEQTDEKPDNHEEKLKPGICEPQTPLKDIPNTSEFDYEDSVEDEVSSKTYSGSRDPNKNQLDDHQVCELGQVFVERDEETEITADPYVQLPLVQMTEKQVSFETVTPFIGEIKKKCDEKTPDQNIRHEINENGEKVQEFRKIEIVEQPRIQKIPDTQIEETEWFKQLTTLSYAQTELTYLCQHQDWIVKFAEVNTEVGVDMYTGKTEVTAIWNTHFVRYQGSCVAEKSKKEARHSSAIACLAQLYLNMEGLWERYKLVKEENPALYQPAKSNNLEVLKNWLRQRVSTPDKVIKLEEEDKFDYRPDVDDYVNRLKSCKKELYYFVAQNNKVFMSPKWITLKKNTMAQWQIEGYVRYEIKQRVYEFRQKNSAKCRKQCEELVSKDLLRNIYRDFPGMFKKFKKTKTVRAFL